MQEIEAKRNGSSNDKITLAVSVRSLTFMVSGQSFAVLNQPIHRYGNATGYRRWVLSHEGRAPSTQTRQG
jgi:hypothetical protein